MSRPRKHIPLSELLASALADKLPQEQRDDLRARKVPAKTIIRLFTPDHVVLHAFGGEDRWHNLTMALRGPELKAKDGRDTRIAAKNKRLRGETCTGPTKKIPKRVNPWPKGQPIPSRVR
jgi:hypothetical protein